MLQYNTIHFRISNRSSIYSFFVFLINSFYYCISMATMTEEAPTPNEIETVFKKLRTLPANKVYKYNLKCQYYE